MKKHLEKEKKHESTHQHRTSFSSTVVLYLKVMQMSKESIGASVMLVVIHRAEKIRIAYRQI